MLSVYDVVGIWLFYIQLAIFIVFFIFVIRYFINIFKEHKKKRNEKIIKLD
jgi:TRAP-type C4-dicarboxylate transport system permease small subunit